jgi:hypothetical protein
LDSFPELGAPTAKRGELSPEARLDKLSVRGGQAGAGMPSGRRQYADVFLLKGMFTQPARPAPGTSSERAWSRPSLFSRIQMESSSTRPVQIGSVRLQALGNMANRAAGGEFCSHSSRQIFSEMAKSAVPASI